MSKLDRMFGHGGLFKTKDVGQKFMAAAINTPVSLMETAVKAVRGVSHCLRHICLQNQKTKHLPISLTTKYSHKVNHNTLEPTDEDVKGFNEFAVRYKNGLPIEKAAVEYLKY